MARTTDGFLRIFLVVCIPLLLSGCSGQSPSEADGDKALVDSKGTYSYAGTILYRLTADEEPLIAESGDPHDLCFRMPPGVSSASFHLTWSPEQPFTLELYWPGGTYRSWELPTEPASLSPIETTVELPPEGNWQIYVGPNTVGGPADWELEITLIGTDLPDSPTLAECP